MVKNIFNTFLCLLLLPLNVTYAQSDNRACIEIDMSSAKTIDFDDLVDNISCKKLEGYYFDSCIDLIPYKGYLYAMGETISGKNMIIYNKDGKFIKEITFPDALIVNSMCIVPALDELWVISRLKMISKFKLDGTLIKRVNLPFNCANAYAVNDHDFLIYSGGGAANIENHYLALTDFKSIEKLFMPQRNKSTFNHWSLYAPDSRKENLFMFFHLIDTIYSYNIKDQQLKPYYKLDFHGDFMLENQVPFGVNEDQEMSDIITKRKYVYSHYSFYQASGKLFFKLVGKRNNFCMINLKDNRLYSFDRLFDDFGSLQINPFVASDGKKLYLLAREGDLVEHYQNIKCTYPALYKLFPTLSPEGNAWILITIDIKT